MVTALLKFHHDVDQGAIAVSLGTEGLVVPTKDELVILPERRRDIV